MAEGEMVMEMQALMDSYYYTWIILPLLVFLARVIDVTIGTVRSIFIIKGFKYVVAAIGFIEILIWLLAMQQIMKNLDNAACFIAYAAGVSTGNFIGIWITEKISLGLVEVKLITRKNAAGLMEEFKQAGYGITRVAAEGGYGPATIVFSVIPRRSLEKVLTRILAFDPQAFYTIEDIRTARQRFYNPERKGPIDLKIFAPLEGKNPENKAGVPVTGAIA